MSASSASVNVVVAVAPSADSASVCFATCPTRSLRELWLVSALRAGGGQTLSTSRLSPGRTGRRPRGLLPGEPGRLPFLQIRRSGSRIVERGRRGLVEADLADSEFRILRTRTPFPEPFSSSRALSFFGKVSSNSVSEESFPAESEAKARVALRGSPPVSLASATFRLFSKFSLICLTPSSSGGLRP